jgi:hypothetical protein
MNRIVLTALVLAALSVTSANASPSRPGTTEEPAHPKPIKHKQTPRAVPHETRHVQPHPASHPPVGKHPEVKHPHAPEPKPQKPPKHHPKTSPASWSRRAHRPVSAPAPSLRRASLPVPTPPPLRGSRDSLVRQNVKTEDEGLERIEDDDDLNDRIARKMLVPVPASAALTVNASLPENLRYCRPWTAGFLSDLARAHAAVFHRPIVVSSAVRTVEYQKQLEKINGNAAPAEGDIVSPHLTGGTIDIAKQDLTRQELGWMRTWLLAQQLAGNIDVEEEFLQACFHITVYNTYAPPPPPPTRKAMRRRPAHSGAIASHGR